MTVPSGSRPQQWYSILFTRPNNSRAGETTGNLGRSTFVVCGGGAHAQSLLRKRAANRAYQRIVDDCLTVLFCGFPRDLLPSLRQRLDNSSLVRRGQAEGTDARACSIQAAVLVIRKIIGSLSKQERQELAEAFPRNDASNPNYKGFTYMFRVVELLNVSPALASYLDIELAGHLRGMSQEAIFKSWVDAQVGRVIGQLRERSREEAARKKDLWQ